MRTPRLTATLILALAALASACVGLSSSKDSPPDPVGSTGSAIEKGSPINQASNPISSQFPMSTVHLSTTSSTSSWSCTGTIISPTQILTAAHCFPVTPTVVSFYPIKAGAGMYPTSTIAATGSPVYPPGVVPCSPDSTTCIANYWTCTGGTGCSSANGTFADLAIVTLSRPVPTPYLPAVLGAPGSFDDDYDSVSAWAVGTGMMNFYAFGGQYLRDDAGYIIGEQGDASDPAVDNPDAGMEWLPVVLWTPGGTNDNHGSFDGLIHYTDHGDSGGPLYQYGGDDEPNEPDAYAADGYDIMLVGVLHGATPDGNQSMWTSVENAVNWAWVTGLIPADAGATGGTGGSPSPHAVSPTGGGGNVRGGTADNTDVNPPVATSRGAGCSSAPSGPPASPGEAVIGLSLAAVVARARRRRARR